MRAAVLIGPRAIEIRDVAQPHGDDNVLIETRCVGICGTDVRIFSGEIPVTYPRIQGHEMCGVVVDGGPSGLSYGTRVVVDPNIACARCSHCRKGRANLCANGTLLGRDDDGALSSSVAVPLEQVHALPDSISNDEAPLIQVLSTCVHAERRAPVFPGDAVVVLGLGVTGLLHIQLARLRGASPVIGITRSPEKRALAERLGADITFDGNDLNLADRLRDANPEGIDLVIESAGKVATLAKAVELVRPGGRILAYGTITETNGPFPYYQLYYKELDIVNARAAQAEDFPVSIEVVTKGSVRLEPLISHHFSFDNTVEAIEAAGQSDSLKVLVRIKS